MAHSIPADKNAVAEQIADPDHAHVGHNVHVVPLWLLSVIFAILMALTLLTVVVTWKDFGYQTNFTIAIAIAIVKGALVGLYFMHLRWDSPVNTLAFCIALLFVGLFIWVGVLDTGQYQRNYDPPQGWVQDTVVTAAPAPGGAGQSGAVQDGSSPNTGH